MNSRYTYKGISKTTGEWVYGFYNYIFTKYDYSEKRHIIMGYDEQGLFFEDEIMPETLCQCTGLQDIEGNYIFENDIVEFNAKRWNNVMTGIISYNQKSAKFVIDMKFKKFGIANGNVKIIGNKFDEVKE